MSSGAGSISACCTALEGLAIARSKILSFNVEEGGTISLSDPVASALHEIHQNAALVERLRAVLPGIFRVDRDGMVEFASQRLSEELSEVFSHRRANRLHESLSAYADGAVLLLDDGQVLVPWRAVEEAVALVGGTPEQLRGALGIQSMTQPKDIAGVLHESQRTLPADVFTERTASLLAHPPRRLAGARLDDDYPWDRLDPDPDTPPIERGGVPAPPTPPAKDDYLSIAACVLAGAWGPYYDDPIFNSGWILGFRVCIPYDCADALARALLEWFVPGKVALGKALLTALAEGSVGAGLQTLASVASFWLAAAFFATGFQMQTANLYSGGRGVCIHFPWPYNPIPVWSSSR
jgi:hypothetical protein